MKQNETYGELIKATLLATVSLRQNLNIPNATLLSGQEVLLGTDMVLILSKLSL